MKKIIVAVGFCFLSYLSLPAAGIGDSPMDFEHDYGRGEILSGGSTPMGAKSIPDLELQWKANKRTIVAVFRNRRAICVTYTAEEGTIENKEFNIILGWNETSTRKWKKDGDKWVRSDGVILYQCNSSVRIVTKEYDKLG